MLIAIIVLSVTLFFLCVLCAYLIGKNTTQSKNKPDTNSLSEQEKELLRKRNEGFQNMMNYDYNTALEGKKVK